MFLRSYVPWFAAGILSVCAEKRTEGPELIPACVQLAPFTQVVVFAPCAVEFLLCRIVASLYRESADVHRPEGDAADREVQTGRNLCFHVLPSCADVTAPCSCGITLKTGETRSCQQEYATVRTGFSLSFIDGTGIHKCVGVEVLLRRTECRRAA